MLAVLERRRSNAIGALHREIRHATSVVNQERAVSEAERLAPAGGPLKPVFGLSGVVRLLDKVFPLLVRVFAPSTPTRSLRVLQRRWRSDENYSTSSLRDRRITLAGYPGSVPFFKR
jgi:hypothetical protein